MSNIKTFETYKWNFSKTSEVKNIDSFDLSTIPSAIPHKSNTRLMVLCQHAQWQWSFASQSTVRQLLHKPIQTSGLDTHLFILNFILIVIRLIIACRLSVQSSILVKAHWYVRIGKILEEVVRSNLSLPNS